MQATSSVDAVLPFGEGMIAKSPKPLATRGQHLDTHQLACRFHDPEFQERPHRGIDHMDFRVGFRPRSVTKRDPPTFAER